MKKHGDDISISSTVQNSQNISVCTPSFAKLSRASHSINVDSHHMANPNPQSGPPKFLGVRDAAFSANRHKYVSSEPDQIRFGRRVNFGCRMTTSQLLQDHLNQIKIQKMTKRYEKESKINQEREWLKSIKREEENEDNFKSRSIGIMKNEFLFFNEQKKLDAQQRKEEERSTKKSEVLDHFPFVAGELIEAHRSVIGQQMRDELRTYLQSKTYSSGKFPGNQTPQLGREKDFTSDRLNRKLVTPALMPPLTASCYLPPELNPQVIQDDHPLKRKTLTDAMKRY